MGPTTPQLLEHILPTPLYKYPPMGHIESSTYKQHNVQDPNICTLVQYLQLWDHRVQ